MEMRDEIPLDEIQGNITPGFRKDFQTLLFIRFPDQESGVDWLASIYPDLTSAREVATYNRLYRQLRHPATLKPVAGVAPRARPSRSADEMRSMLRSTWVNVAFTARGLEALGVDLAGFPAAFTDGLLRRTTTPIEQFVYGPKNAWDVRDSNRFGDDDDDTSALTHAVVIVGADTPDDLKHALKKLDDQFRPHGVVVIDRDDGHTLGDGRMHFGFREGLSQPDPADPLDGWAVSTAKVKNDQIVKPGEFILGCRNESEAPPTEPEWARSGSYLVYLKLHQNVELFDEQMEANAKILTDHGIPTSPQKLAAQVIGRWPSGAKLKPGDDKDPSPDGRPADADIQIVDQDFTGDPLGDVCPLSGHVRRVNPRGEPKDGDGSPLDAKRRRIIRRGVSYGPSVSDAPGKGVDRGLLFLAYQASIEEQFEHIMRSWVNYDGFPPRDSIVGYDSLLGFDGPRHEEPGFLAHAAYHRRGQGGAYEDFVHLQLARCIEAIGGGYFFTPSISAIAAIAREADPVVVQLEEGSLMAKSESATTEETPAPDPGPPGTYAQLARLIQEQLPYGELTTLPRLQGNDIWDQDDSAAKVKMLRTVYPDNRVVRRQGLHATDTAANHAPFKPNAEFTASENNQLINITIPDEDGFPVLYELTKVLRIWYTYTATEPTMGGDTEVGTFIIVGYVGNGQP